MTTVNLTPTTTNAVRAVAALKFITCGSVDDGKSTLIGRLLVDSKTVLLDQLAGVQRAGETDLALLTDGLSAEREQGITIDVAYRYFATAHRKFIIGDAPGHEQYTRNMVTAASSADAAVVLVDATKLPWATQAADSDAATHALLPQTRRHSLLAHLLRVPSIVFAINKLDAVEGPGKPGTAAAAYARIRAAVESFASAAGIAATAIVPVSALKGWNVVDRAADHHGNENPHWCGYEGPSLLQILEQLPCAAESAQHPFAFPVQWVEKFSSSSDTSQGRRVFWGRAVAGAVVGQEVTVFPGGQSARVAQVLDHARASRSVAAGRSAGIVLDREVDVSRGDWLLAPGAIQATRELLATVAWMDDEPLLPGRVYWALHAHRWVKARVKRIVHRLNIHTLAQEDASQLDANAIGLVEFTLQGDLATLPYSESRVLGALILVDTASHRTAGALLVN